MKKFIVLLAIVALLTSPVCADDNVRDHVWSPQSTPTGTGASVNQNGATLNTLTTTGTLTVSGALSFAPANLSLTASPTGTGTVTINPATAGTMNNVSVGATTASTGTFTTLALSGAAYSGGAYTTSSPVFNLPAQSIADTTSSGTVATKAFATINAPTFTASNATTYTNLDTLYLAAPVASTNVTGTNKFALDTPGFINVGGGISSGSITGQEFNLNGGGSTSTNGMWKSATNTLTLTTNSLATLTLLPTASSVDYVTVSGSAAGSPGVTQIGVTGTDSAIGIALMPKSTGGVSIGTSPAKSELDVYGNVAIGTSYAGATAAPTNGLAVQGGVAIGSTSANSEALYITGGAAADTGLTTLSISTATFTPTFNTSNDFSITLVHASCPCTLANPSGTITPGQHGIIYVIQSSTGSDTIGTWGSEYLAPGGTSSITLSTGASAVDVLSYAVQDATHIVIAPVLNVKH